MGAKSYYFEDNQIKTFDDPIVKPEPKGQLQYPYTTMLEGVNILIIDDNPINLIVAEKTLKRFGANTLRALGGEEGIEIFRNETVDLILMDVQMPGLDGFQSCVKLKETVAYKSTKTPVPVIAYTTFPLEELQDQITLAGMDGYIGKPFTQAQVIASLLSYVVNEEDVPKMP